MKFSSILWLCCIFLMVFSIPLALSTGYASAGMFTWFMAAISGYAAAECEYNGI